MATPLNGADLIIVNARIYDPIDGVLPATAVAIFRNLILALDADENVLNLRHRNTTVVDAGGRLLLPAFTDTHTHFVGYVKRQQEINLSDCRSLPEALDRIRQKINQTPRGEWITGGGWNRNLWGDEEFPDRRQLDEISTRHFIALDSKDWHTLWVNTPVLKRLGISVDKPYPNAKHFAIHPVTGEFTGVLEENVRLAVFDLIPPINYDRIRKTYHEVVQQFYRLGFSGIHIVEGPTEFAMLQDAKRRNELGLRAFWYLPVQNIPAAKELAIQNGVGDEFLRICGVKLFVDGSFGSQTAELLEDYRELGHAGVELLTEAQLNQQVSQAVEGGLSCAVHAIGDRAIRKTLRVFGRHLQKSCKYELRHRVEHAQLIHTDDIPLFGKYGVIASMQPVHLAGDIPIIKKYLGKRGRYAYPFASLKKTGAQIIFGSDIPVETFNPWKAIFTAMERKADLNPDQPTFYPQEKLDLITSLQAYTSTAAAAVKMEDRLGRIRPGMLADFFIPNRDILNIPTHQLLTTRSLFTVVDGKIVHDEIH